MAVPYIGNANPPQIYADNVRDDLVPDPINSKVIFDLSQVVPGGSPENVTVIRRKFQIEDVIDSSTNISFDGASDEIRSSNAIASALLSRIQVGQAIIISGSTNPINNGTFKVLSVTYNDPNIAIVVEHDIQTVAAGDTINVKVGIDGPWETLEPDIDYTITGSSPETFDKQIQLVEILQEEDMCYVLHRASATFNLVPSPESVGPSSLQLNLRDFLVERFVGDGSATDFTLTRFPATPRAIMVTVDGVAQDDDEDDTFANGRDYTTDGNTLIFDVPPSNGAKIRVQHLGFSTVSRRASLSAGQIANIPANGVGTVNIINQSITQPKLAISPPAVATVNVQDDAITGQKIKLANEEALKAARSDAGNQGLLRLDASNQTVLMALAAALWEINGTAKGKFTASTIEGQLDADISLGTALKRFKDLFLSGAISAGSASVTGNITVGGTVDGVDVSDLQTQVNNLQSVLPAGLILQYGGASAPTGWLLCDGSVVSQTTYSALFSAIGTTFNTGGEGVGNFRLPDFRLRFPLGKAGAGFGAASILGGSGGNWDHTHSFAHTHNVSTNFNFPSHTHSVGTLTGTAANHTHGMKNHTHGMQNHYHGVPGHYHHVKNYGGNISASGGNHGHNYSDPGHYHTHNHSHPIDAKSNGTSASSGRPDRNNGTVDRGSFNTSGISNPDTDTKLVGITIIANTHGHPTSEFDGYVGRASGGSNGDDGSMNTSGISNNTTTAPNDNTTDGSGTFGVGISGNTGGVNEGAFNVNTTGSSTSQSTSTSGTANPPFLAVNFIIKA